MMKMESLRGVGDQEDSKWQAQYKFLEISAQVQNNNKTLFIQINS